VFDCVCRKQQHLLGRGCDRRLDVCLVMSPKPGGFDNSPVFRTLTREEAGAVLKRAAEAGLLHSTSNTQVSLPYFTYICNCCPCCCGILRGIGEFGIAQSIAHSAFWSAADTASCTGCELCLERSHFGALTMQDGLAQVDRERCIGCGLCVWASLTSYRQRPRHNDTTNLAFEVVSKPCLRITVLNRIGR